MQTQNIKTKRSRTRDFPEHQVGYPERNDASSPNHDSGRTHDSDETARPSRKSARELTREMKSAQS